MKDIKNEELANYGIDIKCNIMDNGEKRFRLVGDDGSSYIRTEATKDGGWQNSHYHTTIKEMYLVQRGQIILVELKNGETIIKKYSEGEFCITNLMIPHNVYMYPNTVTHTVKFGNCTKPDWNEYKELDEIVKKIELNIGEDYKNAD